MRIIPLTLKEANAFVEDKHRHHKRVQGQKFSIGLIEGDRLIGVAIAGRPVARLLDDGNTLEVTRLCTDGTSNACSKLYGTMARIAKEMGYEKIITYILVSEPGTSLRAAGWQLDGEFGGGTWDRPNRSRLDKHPIERKQRWSKHF